MSADPVAMLHVDRLSVRYGGVQAIDAASLSVPRGHIVGLIGPNGAGKTSLVDAIAGFTAYTGTVRVDGEIVDRLPPHQRVRRGLARTWQSVELFDDLSVLENVSVGNRRIGWRGIAADVFHPGRSRDLATERWALQVVGLEPQGEASPRELSLGQAKLLGVARALAARPKVVLLDEPAAGLDTAESARLGRQLRDLLAHDVSILLIDHDMELVLQACDHIYVLDLGRVIASGTPAEVRSNPAVIGAYLGHTVNGEESVT